MSLSFRLVNVTVLGMVLHFVPAAAQPSPPSAESPVTARIDSLVQEFMSDHGPAGISVSILHGPEPLVQRAWGVADVSMDRPAAAGMTYRIGSISKQFTAALLLKMVDRGSLSLSDSIGHHLTGLRPEWRPIRIEQLLNHTSGLPREFRDSARRAEELSADSLIALAASGDMAFAPGTSWAYSNTGYLLLGLLVEKLYEKPYGEALRDEIARPLGLATLGWCADAEKARTATTGYERSGPEELTAAVYLHPSQSLGSGGICASAGDLAEWNRALHGGRVLSPAMYSAMITPRGAASAGGYGFGVRVGRSPWGGPLIFHTGGTDGFAAENAWFPAESLSVAVLYNTAIPSPAGEPLPLALARAALGILEAPRAPTPASQSPTAAPESADAPFSALVGEYQFGARQTLTISVEDGQLFGQPTGDRKLAMVPQPGGTFDVAAIHATVTFVVGSDGRATAMVLRRNGREMTLPRIR